MVVRGLIPWGFFQSFWKGHDAQRLELLYDVLASLLPGEIVLNSGV